MPSSHCPPSLLALFIVASKIELKVARNLSNNATKLAAKLPQEGATQCRPAASPGAAATWLSIKPFHCKPLLIEPARGAARDVTCQSDGDSDSAGLGHVGFPLSDNWQAKLICMRVRFRPRAQTFSGNCSCPRLIPDMKWQQKQQAKGQISLQITQIKLDSSVLNMIGPRSGPSSTERTSPITRQLRT